MTEIPRAGDEKVWEKLNSSRGDVEVVYQKTSGSRLLIRGENND